MNSDPMNSLAGTIQTTNDAEFIVSSRKQVARKLIRQGLMVS